MSSSKRNDWRAIDRIEKPYRQSDPGFTQAEYMSRYGYARSAAGSRLARLVSEGKLIRGVRRMPDSLGRSVQKAVYRPA